MTREEINKILDRYSLQTVCDLVYLNGWRIGLINSVDPWLIETNSYYFYPRDNGTPYFNAEEFETFVQQKILEVKQEIVEQELNKIKEDFT